MIEPTPVNRAAGRRSELTTNLAQVRDRIAAACAAASRPVDDVELIAITKTFPASDVLLLAELGIAEVGESRDQEAVQKIREVGEIAASTHVAAPVLHWHFVGALQTNKCASVVTYASLVHSVDRLRLVAALGRAAEDRQVPRVQPLQRLHPLRRLTLCHASSRSTSTRSPDQAEPGYGRRTSTRSPRLSPRSPVSSSTA